MIRNNLGLALRKLWKDGVFSVNTVTGLGTFMISVRVVLYQTLRAARANPVDSLRYE